ncbi:glycosyltransferase [Amnibacterium kyonggiense]|uniref:glycosyltransferase n=1 Tax=Amnibacterium kyonggiense TaxID=595671 RepID=UPI001B873049|nr:glycosyltransferase [Amnibacterium kyonggiense]
MEPRGGSERVAAAIADAFPGSDVVVPWNNAPRRLEGHDVRESWLARSPFRDRKALAALVLPAVWRRVVPKQRDYDWVIASSHLFSHHIRLRGRSSGRPKFVYVHSPARYIWNPELDDRGASAIARLVSVALKPIDRLRAKEATSIAANSEYVRTRVQRAWGRDAIVIHPPVDVDRIAEEQDWAVRLGADERSVLDGLPGRFVLGASRFVSYKRLDVVIRAGEAAGLPVVLAGSGPDRTMLEAMATHAAVPVMLVDDPSDAMLYALYQRADVFVFPPVEDFGMMPVEAMAAGTPVVANAIGGARESVRPGLSGVLLDDFEPQSLARAVEEALTLDRERIREHAMSFSVEAFQARVHAWVDAA